MPENVYKWNRGKVVKQWIVQYMKYNVMHAYDVEFYDDEDMIGHQEHV